MNVRAKFIGLAKEIRAIEDGFIYPVIGEPFRPVAGDEYLVKHNPGPGGFYLITENDREFFFSGEEFLAMFRDINPVNVAVDPFPPPATAVEESGGDDSSAPPEPATDLLIADMEGLGSRTRKALAALGKVTLSDLKRMVDLEPDLTALDGIGDVAAKEILEVVARY